MHDCAAVDAEVAQLRAEVAQLKAAVAKMNAPVPPPWLKRDLKKSRPKTPGAREGHEPRHREQKPVDDEKDAKFSSCPECDSQLGEPIEVRERRVEEIVPARLKVTLFHVHRYWCSACKKRVEAQPEGVLPGQRFGLQLMLLVCYLRTLGMTWEKTRAYFQDAYDVRISHGALVHMESVVAEALGPKYDELIAEVRKAKSVHVDETGWRIDGENNWLWAFLAKGVAWYTVRDTRSRKVAEENLGPSFDGVVVSDFYPSYKNLPYRQQKCLVHLLREIERFEKKPDFVQDAEWKSTRMRIKRLVTEALDGRTLALEEREALQARLIARAYALSKEAWSNKYAKTISHLMGQYHESLFTFLENPTEVHWENNPAERAIRPMVVNRKVSFGSRSQTGADRLAVIQSVAQTARLRDESFFDFAQTAIGHERMPGT